MAFSQRFAVASNASMASGKLTGPLRAHRVQLMSLVLVDSLRRLVQPRAVAERTAMAPTTATSSPGIVKSFPSKRKESKVKVVKKKASKDGADLDVSQSKGVECFFVFCLVDVSGMGTSGSTSVPWKGSESWLWVAANHRRWPL